MSRKRRAAAPKRRDPRLAGPSPTQTYPPVDAKPSFHIVGVGGSAGGLEAFSRFFTQMPTKTGMAFVVVSHFGPMHKAMLAELLQRTTDINVTEITDGIQVRPNHAYVIPPNYDLSILHGKLLLIEPTAPHGLRMPIDFFFKQLAIDQQEKAVGVVLSGMGSDGTLGLRFIKEHCGLAMAQDPASAKFDSMPRSAINSGQVDIIATAEELPARLIQYLARKPVFPQKILPEPDESGNAMEKLFLLLRTHSGNDFSFYKNATILRRIQRRMRIHQFDSLTQYIRSLRENPHELDLLYKELLIGVTNFFRDPDMFEFLKETAIPSLLQSHADGRPVRVWIPACSTGEEAYSLAIVINETLAGLNLPKPPRIQIFATDIDNVAVEKARQGTYLASIGADVSPERLKRFFSLDGDVYRIGKEIRKQVIFAPQNLLLDPPFTKIDILCCRNFFIYINPQTQTKLLGLMHYALSRGGLLILGLAESLGSSEQLFVPLDRKWRVFQRQETTQVPVITMPAYNVPRERVPNLPTKNRLEATLDISYAAQRAVLDLYAPPSVVINTEGDIFYVNGRTGQYLEPSSGKVNMNVFAMAREGLREELGIAIHRARQKKTSVTIGGVQVKSNGGHIAITLIVKPLTESAGTLGLLLVIFDEVPSSPTAVRNEVALPVTLVPAAKLAEQLRCTQELFQVTNEEKQAVEEELHSLNEELQSNNEELQSANEELTTSKEELQSLNEEMQSVNAELQVKLNELSQTHDDMTNLFNDIEIATIFLDGNLCVRRFTPQAVRIVNLIFSDRGRPLAHLVTNLKNDRLVEDARKVLDTLVTWEGQAQALDGRWYQMRIHPYRTTDNVINGVVCTFTDITAIKQVEAELKEARRFAESIIATIREPLVVLDPQLRIVMAGHAFYKTFHMLPDQTEGRFVYELGNGALGIPALRRFLEAVLPADAAFEDFRMEHDFPIVGRKSLSLNARRIGTKGDQTCLILLAIEDITVRSLSGNPLG